MTDPETRTEPMYHCPYIDGPHRCTGECMKRCTTREDTDTNKLTGRKGPPP